VRKLVLIALIACIVMAALPAFAQIRQTKEQIMFYTSGWKGERFPDGRPKLPDDLLKRALDVPIEDVQGFLRGLGYTNVYEGGWQMLHPEKPFAGRALTSQFVPSRPEIRDAVAAEGKAEGRAEIGTNSWVIAELQEGDTMVVDGYSKVFQGTIIGSNLGAGIAAHTKGGFVFDAGIRDRAENEQHEGLNGLYRGYDPSAWADMQLLGINVPVRIGKVTVLPGDLILGTRDGLLVIPAQHAAAAISRAEFTQLEDAYNFELNRAGANAGMFEGGWNAQKYAGLAKWVEAHPEKLKMSKAEFNDMLQESIKRSQTPRGPAGKKP
jgi:4-hydroxy-4-methyl-2-oxoglutarate aldolase